MRSLLERLQAFEQKKARLADIEAKLKMAEKKAHTRRLIEIGGLVERAGLSDLADEVIYGALLSLRRDSDDGKRREQWATAGAQAIAEEDRALDESREPIVLTFPGAPTKEMVAQLRMGGFRFNKILSHWEGIVQFEEAEQLASTYNGAARKLNPDSLIA